MSSPARCSPTSTGCNGLTRYFNVSGPRRTQARPTPASSRVHVVAAVPAAARHLRRRQATRDFTYVAKSSTGVLRACEAANVAGEMMNLAAGGRISLNRLRRALNTRAAQSSPSTAGTAGDVTRLAGGHLSRRPRAARLPAARLVRRRARSPLTGVDVHAAASSRESCPPNSCLQTSALRRACFFKTPFAVRCQKQPMSARPRRKPPPQTSRHRTPPAASSETTKPRDEKPWRPTVLVVDDDLDARTMYGLLFSSRGAARSTPRRTAAERSPGDRRCHPT